MTASGTLETGSPAGQGRYRAALPALAIVVITLVAYVPAIRGGFIWDDPDYVLNNEHLRTVEGLGRIWIPRNTPQFYPLTFTTFWIEYHLWDTKPLGYHLINVALHAISSVLVWRLLRSIGVPGAWCCAAVFAVHPVHVESVAWITERKNVLSGVFYLLSLGWYLRYERDRSWRSYAVAMALFVAALLSKTVTATLPIALLIVGWYRRGRIGVGDVARIVPFLLVGAIFGMLTAVLEREHVGASGEEWALDFSQRVVLAGRVLWFYAGKLIVPLSLTFVYPRWEPESLSGVMWLAPMGAAGALLVLWVLRERIGRGAAAGAAFFAVTLFPAAGFVDVFPFRYSFVADHFQYLASLGLIVPIAATMARALSGGAVWRWGSGLLIAGASLALLAGLTWRQGWVYHDEESLWRDTLAKNPAAWMAHFNLGLVYENRGDADEAFAEYLETIRWRPQHHKAHMLLARDYTTRGDIAAAERHYRLSLDANPKVLTPNINLGNIYAKQGRYSDAIRLYHTALGIRADSPEAHFALANVYLAMGTFAKAVEHYQASLLSGEDDAAARANLGMSLLQLGRIEAAIEQFERALGQEAGQTETRLLLAGALSRQRKYAEAVAAIRTGLDLEAGDPRLLKSLAWILATCPQESVRDGSEAVRLAERIRESGPRNDIGALKTAAAAYAEVGRWDDAQRAARAARTLAATAGDARQLQQVERMLASFENRRPFRTGE